MKRKINIKTLKEELDAIEKENDLPKQNSAKTVNNNTILIKIKWGAGSLVRSIQTDDINGN